MTPSGRGPETPDSEDDVLTIAGHDVRRGDAATVQAVFETDPDYFPRVEAAPLRPDEGAQCLVERPPRVPVEAKHVWVVGGVAVLDVLHGYPTPTTWYLGLIFLAPAARGGGLGTTLIEALCDHAAARGGTALRLAVTVGHDRARRLYDRLGFAFVARKTRTGWNAAAVECDVLERPLVPHPPR